jgi:hypothetical protein
MLNDLHFYSLIVEKYSERRLLIAVECAMEFWLGA